MKRLFALSMVALSLLSGCMTTKNGNKPDNEISSQNYTKKTIAVLPVKSQTSLTTDSATPMKKALNKRISKMVKIKLPGVEIVEQQDCLEKINDAGKLEVLDKLISGYDNTGAFDKKLVASLCTTLKSDYILLPRLKIEQMNAVIAKTFVSSLEVLLLSKTSSEPVWNGIGDFKRFGIYGLGGVENDEAAQELVNLSFGKLEQ